MKIIGVILIVLGILGFLFGGISFTQRETVAEIGPIEVQREETRTFPIAPIASAAALIAGIGLVIAGSRRA